MWHELLERNTFIGNLYSDVPELKNVRIAGIKIHDEGGRLTIEFDMPVYAEFPPEKWIKCGDNTVFVEADFFDLTEVNIQSTESIYRGDIKITKDENNLIDIQISGTIQAQIKAGFGMIQSVRGYINGEIGL